MACDILNKNWEGQVAWSFFSFSSSKRWKPTCYSGDLLPWDSLTATRATQLLRTFIEYFHFVFKEIAFFSCASLSWKHYVLEMRGKVSFVLVLNGHPMDVEPEGLLPSLQGLSMLNGQGNICQFLPPPHEP